MFRYEPGQTKSNSVNRYTPLKSKPEMVEKEVVTESSAESFIAPDLQKLVDQASERMKKEQEESVTHVPTEEDWDWFKAEQKRLLEETEKDMTMGSALTLAQKDSLFKYRQALYEMPTKLPQCWTRESIVWPQKPL